jgi:hypothetical protein
MTRTSADEIRALLFEYCQLFDRGDIDAVARLFEHTTLYGEGGVVVQSSDLVKGFRQRAILYDGDPRTMHGCTNVSLDIDEDAGRATARSVFVPFQAAPGFPLQIYTAGRYRDRFERVDGKWRFTERAYLTELVGDMSAHYRAGNDT